MICITTKNDIILGDRHQISRPMLNGSSCTRAYVTIPIFLGKNNKQPIHKIPSENRQIGYVNTMSYLVH